MINVHILKASGSLRPYIKDILASAKDAITQIKMKIPITNVDIVFYDEPKAVIPNIGLGGRAYNAHMVLVALDPQFKNFKRTVKHEILRALAHELHHCVRIKDLGYGKTLVEAIVSEGLADHFDVEVSGKPPQVWCRALNNKEKKRLEERTRKEYHDTNYSHKDWFLGSKERNIPKWTGYTLGFDLVGKYLKLYYEKKASQLYSVKSEEILSSLETLGH